MLCNMLYSMCCNHSFGFVIGYNGFGIFVIQWTLPMKPLPLNKGHGEKEKKISESKIKQAEI